MDNFNHFYKPSRRYKKLQSQNSAETQSWRQTFILPIIYSYHPEASYWIILSYYKVSGINFQL